MKGYRHLELKDRKKIAKLKSYKLSISEIARRTGFNKSTISREIRRNGYRVLRDNRADKEMLKFFARENGIEKETIERMKDYCDYWSYTNKSDIWARERRTKASKRSKTSLDTKMWIRKKLREGWSPQQVAGRSKIEGPEKVSHEFIYQFILKDRKAGGDLHRGLKRFGKRKQRLGKRLYKTEPIIGRVGIEKRPAKVQARNRLGDLEGDLIIGYKQRGHLLTLIDRASRKIAIEPVASRKMEVIKKAFLTAFTKMPAVKTLTLDNAREFNCHRDLSKIAGVEVYFADPYASHQRGSIENANGLIRYYFPKKTDFSLVSAAKIKAVEQKLNERPRKILGYLTPLEITAKKQLISARTVALQS